MPDVRPEDMGDETPTLEVRVYRRGRLVARELCESEEAAASVVAAWEETEGVECEVQDLSAVRHDESALEVEPPEAGDAYPTGFDTTEPS